MVLSANPHTPNHGAAHILCVPGGYDTERARFFPRMVVKADDLTQDQNYHRARSKRHNRFLHGWGVVCGGEVMPGKEDWTVCITPAYILGPEGDEILIDCCVTLDLSKQDLDGNAMLCGADADPWCSSVNVDRPVGQTLYIAVKYAEYPARPVHVQPGACSCGGSACEYSRTRDGYQLRVLDKLPSSYERLDPAAPPFECLHGNVRECPACPPELWVILAAVKVNDKKIAASDIDNATYRRYVASFSDWWWRCAEDKPPTTVIRHLFHVQGDVITPDLAVQWEIP